MNKLQKAKEEFKKLVDSAETPVKKLESAIIKKRKSLEENPRELSNHYLFITGNFSAVKNGAESPVIRAVNVADFNPEAPKSDGEIKVIVHDPTTYVETLKKEAQKKEAEQAPKGSIVALKYEFEEGKESYKLMTEAERKSNEGKKLLARLKEIKVELEEYENAF